MATLLLTEDDAHVRQFVAEVLEDRGYTVLQAANPSAALALCQRHPGGVDLLLTDFVMPELNGPQLAEVLRSTTPKLRVLFMSGYPDASFVAGELGRSRLLRKPFTPEELVESVERALRDP
jgi:two-component system, cell cycle sensor histidine kinase and response regulator CckA